MIFKKVIVTILTIFLATCAIAQQITIQSFATGSYGAGASISIPIKTSGCFALNNKFEMYLSDASGSFSSPVKIGTYDGFFTPFINGVIPAGTAAGTNYKIRIVSTAPATSIETSQLSIASTTSLPVLNPVTTPSNTLNDSTYGRCLISSNQSIVLQESVPAGSTLSATIVDSSGSTVTASVNTDQVQFTMAAGNYYVANLQIKNNSDNTISTKRFLVLACFNNLSLQTSGPNDVCLPDIKSYTINVTGNGGIKNNYPGTRYSIEWGDGVIDSYTHCQLIKSAGEMYHTYTTTSCGRPPITDLNPVQYNAFRVNVRAKNDFCPNSFTSITTYAKAWEKPKADFVNPIYGCINKPITFANTSQPGLSGYNNIVNCIDVAIYEWYVDGKLIFNAPKDLTYTFTTTGWHTIRLVAVNDPCSADTTQQICIETPLIPNFKINGQDSLKGCGPMTVNIENLTTIGNEYSCRPYKGKWSVLLSPSLNRAVEGVDYTMSPNDSAVNPVITFTKPGEYLIRLSVGNACGDVSKDLKVTITDVAGVKVPVTDMRFCGTKTIDFSTSQFKPIYNSNIGNETFSWKITGGPYSFLDGTSATSPYPKVSFHNFKSYRVNLTFNNACGTQSTSFELTFDEALTATANNDTTICSSNATNIQVSGTSTGPVSSVNWTIANGSGTLSNSAITNPIYTFSAGDISNGKVVLVYGVNGTAGSACSFASDTVVININPNNTITSADSISVCTGSSVNYNPSSTVAGSTYSWTSTVVSGTVTGNTANGTGSINDVLVNPSSTLNAVVKYTITPFKQGCNGQPFNLFVTVVSKPQFTITSLYDSLCTGQKTNIKFTSSYAGARYSWTALSSSPNVTGFSSQSTPATIDSIFQQLINTGTQPETVTYTVKVFGSNGQCDGETKTVSVVVKPGATVANAGPDQILCNATGANLLGNIPSVGTSSWRQLSGPQTTILNAGSYNPTVLGLEVNKTYRYIYSITGLGSCPSTTDTVVIENRTRPTANAGADIVICSFTGVTDSVKLAGNTSATFEKGTWKLLLPKPNGSNPVIVDSSKPNSTFIFDRAGTYRLVWSIANDAGCPPSADTVVVNIINKPVADTLTPSKTAICKGENVTVTAGNNTGNIKKWQYNPAPFYDNVWIDTLTTSNFLNFYYLQDSLKVRVIVQSNSASGCNLADTSKEVTINVTSTATGGKTAQSDSVCSGNNRGSIRLSGHIGNIKYWEYSTNNGTHWTRIFDTASSVTYNNLNTTTWYRAVVQSGACPAVYSDTSIITVMNAVSQAKVSNDKITCNSSVLLEGNTPAKGEVGTWTQLTGPNTANISAVNNPLVTATGLVGGTYQFIWTLSNGGCPPTKDTLTIHVRPPVTKANAGTDIIVCDFYSNASVSLSGNIDSSRTFETGTWSILSQPQGGNGKLIFGNTSGAATGFSFNAPGTYRLQWMITNDIGCDTTYDTLSIKAYPPPLSGIITANLNSCVGSDVSVAMGNYVGKIKKWQYNPAPINDNIWRDTMVTSSIITFISIRDTFEVRAIVESSGMNDGCSSTDTSNVLLINAAPFSMPGTTGPDNTVCASNNIGTIKLTGNLGKIVKWEFTNNNGATWNVINNTADSIIYKNLKSTTWFKAVSQSALCGNVSSSITVITVLDSVTQAEAGYDQLLCDATQTTLEGNVTGSAEQGVWSQLAGTAATISDVNVPNPTVSNLKPGIYTFLYTISNSTCPPKSDTVVVTINSALVNIIDTTSKNICSGQPVTVGGQAATGGNGTYNYQWQVSADGTNWKDIPDQTNVNLTIIPEGSIYVRRVVTSLPCSDTSSKAFIGAQPPITDNSVIGNDQNLCINTAAAVLVGSLPNGYNGGYNYQWQQSIDGGTTWTNIAAGTSKDYNPGVVKISAKYRRNVSANLCTGPQSNTSNIVDIIVNPNATADFTALKDTSCPPFKIDTTVIKTKEYAGNKDYQWFANGRSIGSGSTFPGYTINTSNDSVVIKLVTKSIFGCKDDSVQHKFYTRLKAYPDFTLSDSVGCGPLAITITNKTPNFTSFTYKWNFGTGQTSTAANPGAIVFPANPNYGDTTYKVALTVFSECDSTVIIKNVLVHSKVKAIFTPDHTFGCSPFPVTFTNKSKGAIGFTWDFGDGTVINTATTESMKHTYVSKGRDTFVVKLIARSDCGIDTQRYSIIMTPNNINLFVTVNGTEKFGCSPHAVNLINNTTGATSYRWDFGDGNVLTTTRNNDTIPHMYEKPGVYNVKVIASNNCTDTTGYVTITVLAKPKVDFSPQALTACLGDTIRFTNLTDTITGALWKFGDGTTSTLTNPLHKYAAPGVYTVTLQGIRQYPSGNVCMDSTTKTVTVVASLPGSFSVSDSVSSCVPFTVTFKNLNLPSALTAWDFGDGKKDTGNVVTHTYTTTGSYKATMFAVSPAGCKYNASKSIVVKGPKGTWQYDEGLICGTRQVRFEALTTGVDSFKYNFGDGVILVTKNSVVYHTYTKAGKFLPSLELMTGATCRSILPGLDTIKVEIIKAEFTASLVKECGQTKVAFNNTTRSYFGVSSWSWTLGDGNTSSVKSPQNNYTTANTYPVKLIATGVGGCADTVSLPVQVPVNNKPIVSIFSDTVACIGSSVSYRTNVVSKDSVGFMYWRFSNGATSNNATFSTRYGTAGNQSATLVVSTINGCSDTTTKPILINPAPLVRTIEDKTICLGESIQLTTTGAANYSWTPVENISCQNCSNPTTSPINTMTYIVSAVNSFGCIGKDSVTISVSKPFKIKTNPADTVCAGGSRQLLASGAELYKWFPGSTLNRTDIPNPVALSPVSTAYRVVGYDSAGCFTDTAYVSLTVGPKPTIDLGPDKVLSAGTLLPLTSTVTNGPITKWDWLPYTDLSCTNCPEPVATIKRDINYAVRATNAYGCSATDTIRIKVFCENTQVYIPNVFTPDHDGINDVLMVRGTGINTVKLFRIFNRWGEVVFEKANFAPNDKGSGWDGMVRGVPAPPEVYVYTCEVLCENDVAFNYKGNVAIVK